MRVLIYGPQGSGKSTQAQLLAEKLKVSVISAGQISRELSSQDNEEGRWVKNLVDKGEPTPQEIIVREVNKKFDDPSCQNGFVMDGYPRYAQQIESLVAAGEERGWEIDKVIVINLPEDVGQKRILSRAKLESRDDDTPESIKRRLELYHQQTEPIIDYFKKLGKVMEVDGSGTIEEVFSLICQVI
jgi:adenylate kinase